MKFGRSEELDALRTGLRETFDFFGGVPQHALFDNPKTVVIERDAYGEGLHRWNEGLRQLAEECGFTPRLCRPFRANTKGKVERFNGYLKGSFLVPMPASLEAAGLRRTPEVANAHVRRWLDDVANVRVHATTSWWRWRHEPAAPTHRRPVRATDDGQPGCGMAGAGLAGTAR